MDNSEFKKIKQEMSGKVNAIFDDFEESNNRLPTMEEFRVIIADTADNYLGPMEQNTIDGINTNLERQRIREKSLWDAVTELEAEVRLRHDSDC
ncbi:hypothetical protein [Photobacterium aquimaris]|uniref:Uncharacterized protein n=1 Tax=Photobacterium aquimaris TaxID=512643 RepID=A0A2T3HW52_9GAMM|nr:hypothetical protein [Photobacterium aquimaris]OBU15466.1 hypothetical protein AYY21_05760 [Photobacterium aquimaris]PQJ38573.1 hypothetical protein BTN98_14310 [Photobacterium aquimaris]PSU02998.1 hypothetical protein C0W81_13180 [Photobacterium aquimaris]